MNTEVLNSEAYKRAERNRAQKVLEYAKSLGRKVRKATSGECEFSLKFEPIKKPENIAENLLTIPKAADYLRMTRHTLEKRVKRFNIPYTLVGKTKYFDIPDLDEHILNNPVRKSDLRQ